MAEDLAQEEAWIGQCLEQNIRLRGESSKESLGPDQHEDGDAGQEDQEVGEAAPTGTAEEGQRLRNVIHRLYVRVRRLEATLSGKGIEIEEFDDEEGEALKAGCEHILGFDDAENTSEASNKSIGGS